MCDNVVIWGYGFWGSVCFLRYEKKYNILAFADNSIEKQGYVCGNGIPILSMNEIIALKKTVDFKVIIASESWFKIGREIDKLGIEIGGIYRGNGIEPYNPLTFDQILNKHSIVKLYAGDIYHESYLNDDNVFGLSITKSDSKHIYHDITWEYPIPDDSIDIYYAEDVFEHIEYSKLTHVIDEIYRVLKPGGLLRVSMPDYNCKRLKNITMCNMEGDLIYDPNGGGDFRGGQVINGGHVWFPTYDCVKELFEQSKFERIDYLCFRDEKQNLELKEIDFSKGHICRIEDKLSDKSRISSILVDCVK